MLTIQEAADRLRVSVRTVEREIAAGKLRAFKVRRLTRIPEPELQGYISRACLSANVPTTGRSAGVRPGTESEGRARKELIFRGKPGWRNW
jgi:excisionase family DNA binding protein